MPLQPSRRRLAAYLYLQDFVSGDVLALAPPDAQAEKLLKEHGARSVEFAELGSAAARPAGRYALVLALDVAPEELAQAAQTARRLTAPDGRAVLGCESRERPGSKSGASYYDVLDAAQKHFPAVTMVGLAPFAGATLVEYGVKEPEPLLDGTLVEKGERVEWYLAVAGRERTSAGGYVVVQLPLVATDGEVAAPAPRPSAPAERDRDRGPDDVAERLAQREKALEEAREAARLHAAAMAQVRAELAERTAYVAELERDAKGAVELRETARRAAARADAAEARERQARLELARAEGALRRSSAPAAVVSSPDPTPIATAAPASDAPSAPSGDAETRIAGLMAEVARLKQKEEEARVDSWKHLKARSDAEAQAAEVREDTVRKLKDARKLASAELMRAMEEATKKAVGLREELARSEKERKELAAALSAARAEMETLRSSAGKGGELELARAREEAGAQVLAARAQALRNVHDEESGRAAAELAARAAEERGAHLHLRVVALEREQSERERALEAERERAAQLGTLLRQLEAELFDARKLAAQGEAVHGAQLASAKADHERLGRMLADVEKEALARADTALRMRRELKEREREVESLRRELAARDARLTALEKLHPPAPEVERMEAELAQARRRVLELEEELARRQAMIDRAAQAAAHERARAERLVAEERRAMTERNETRTRVGELESRVAGAELERERLASLAAAEAERARKAENEARERKERVKQLKRELEDIERRLATVDVVRARLETVEAELRGETARMEHLEEALRNVASAADADGPVS